MLPKTHLTSDSKISGSRWIITPLRLTESWRFFFFCIVVLCILAPSPNIFCLCQVHTISVLYCAHLCMKCSFGISNFLEEITSLPHSIVFLCFFALITEEGFLISRCSLELCIQMDICLYFSPLPFTSLLFSTICKASSDNHLSFCVSFSPLEMVLIPDSCTMSWRPVHSSWGTLSYLILWIYLSLPLYIIKNFI